MEDEAGAQREELAFLSNAVNNEALLELLLPWIVGADRSCTWSQWATANHVDLPSNTHVSFSSSQFCTFLLALVKQQTQPLLSSQQEASRSQTAIVPGTPERGTAAYSEKVGAASHAYERRDEAQKSGVALPNEKKSDPSLAFPLLGSEPPPKLQGKWAHKQDALSQRFQGDLGPAANLQATKGGEASKRRIQPKAMGNTSGGGSPWGNIPGAVNAGSPWGNIPKASFPSPASVPEKAKASGAWGNGPAWGSSPSLSCGSAASGNGKKGTRRINPVSVPHLVGNLSPAPGGMPKPAGTPPVGFSPSAAMAFNQASPSHQGMHTPSASVTTPHSQAANMSHPRRGDGATASHQSNAASISHSKRLDPSNATPHSQVASISHPQRAEGGLVASTPAASVASMSHPKRFDGSSATPHSQAASISHPQRAEGGHVASTPATSVASATSTPWQNLLRGRNVASTDPTDQNLGAAFSTMASPSSVTSKLSESKQQGVGGTLPPAALHPSPAATATYKDSHRSQQSHAAHGVGDPDPLTLYGHFSGPQAHNMKGGQTEQGGSTPAVPPSVSIKPLLPSCPTSRSTEDLLPSCPNLQSTEDLLPSCHHSRPTKAPLCDTLAVDTAPASTRPGGSPWHVNPDVDATESSATRDSLTQITADNCTVGGHDQPGDSGTKSSAGGDCHLQTETSECSVEGGGQPRAGVSKCSVEGDGQPQTGASKFSVEGDCQPQAGVSKCIVDGDSELQAGGSKSIVDAEGELQPGGTKSSGTVEGGPRAGGTKCTGDREGNPEAGAAGEAEGGGAQGASTMGDEVNPQLKLESSRLARIHSAILLHGCSDALLTEVSDLINLLSVSLSPSATVASISRQPSSSTAAVDPPHARKPLPQSPTHWGPNPPHQSAPLPASPHSGGHQSLALLGIHPWSKPLAASYVCCVLDLCTPLFCALGGKMSGLLLECPLLQAHCPKLCKALESAQRQQHMGFRSEKHHDFAGIPPMPLVGLLRQSDDTLSMASGSSIARARSQEQQRRTVNRERCRDALFGLIRDASAFVSAISAEEMETLAQLIQDPSAYVSAITAEEMEALAQVMFVLKDHVLELSGSPTPDHCFLDLKHSNGNAAANTPQLEVQFVLKACLLELDLKQSSGNANSPQLEMDLKQSNTAANSPQLEVMFVLKARVLELVGSLHPSNEPFFAELFAMCVLQAATTGEALMEGAVASLAMRNPSKFQALNQRLQAQGQGQGAASFSSRSVKPAGANTGGGGLLQERRHPINDPMPSFSQQGGSRYGAVGGGRGVGYGGISAHSMPSYGSDSKDMYVHYERFASSLRLLKDFPPVQRSFALILELCDSHSIISSVQRCMAAKLNILLESVATICNNNSSSNGGGGGVSGRDNAGQGKEKKLPPNGGAADKSTRSGEEGHANGLGRMGSAVGGSHMASALNEQVLSMGTLAFYLSYLTFCNGMHPTHSFGGAMDALNAADTPWLTPHRDLAPHHQAPFNQAPSRHRSLAFCVHQCPQHVDVLALLDEAVRVPRLLTPLIPVVAQYLVFLHHDTPACASPYFRAVAKTLAALHTSDALRPGPSSDSYFGISAVCIRSVLEDLTPHVSIVLKECIDPYSQGGHDRHTTDSAAATLSRDQAGELDRAPWDGQLGREGDTWEGGAHSGAGLPEVRGGGKDRGKGPGQGLPPAAESLVQGLLESDSWVDSRFVELCCPALGDCARRLQRALLTSSAVQPGCQVRGGLGELSLSRQVAPPRKISLPTLTSVRPRQGPGLTSTSGPQGASMGLPPAVLRVLQRGPGGAESTVQLQLQQAFLAQYSTDEQPVKMRDVVGSVANILSATAFSTAMGGPVAVAAAAAVEKLQEAAMAHIDQIQKPAMAHPDQIQEPAMAHADQIQKPATARDNQVQKSAALDQIDRCVIGPRATGRQAGGHGDPGRIEGAEPRACEERTGGSGKERNGFASPLQAHEDKDGADTTPNPVSVGPQPADTTAAYSNEGPKPGGAATTQAYMGQQPANTTQPNSQQNTVEGGTLAAEPGPLGFTSQAPVALDMATALTCNDPAINTLTANISTANTPAVNTSTTNKPAINTPTTIAPITIVPTTIAPTTSNPANEKPVVDSPAIGTHTVKAPISLDMAKAAVAAVMATVTDAATHQALQDAVVHCETTLAVLASTALTSLLPPTLPPSVIQAGATLSASSALSACTRRLVHQVPISIHSQLERTAEYVARNVVKLQMLRSRSTPTNQALRSATHKEPPTSADAASSVPVALSTSEAATASLQQPPSSAAAHASCTQATPTATQAVATSIQQPPSSAASPASPTHATPSTAQAATTSPTAAPPPNSAVESPSTVAPSSEITPSSSQTAPAASADKTSSIQAATSQTQAATSLLQEIAPRTSAVESPPTAAPSSEITPSSSQTAPVASADQTSSIQAAPSRAQAATSLMQGAAPRTSEGESFPTVAPSSEVARSPTRIDSAALEDPAFPIQATPPTAQVATSTQTASFMSDAIPLSWDQISAAQPATAQPSAGKSSDAQPSASATPAATISTSTAPAPPTPELITQPSAMPASITPTSSTPELITHPAFTPESIAPALSTPELITQPSSTPVPIVPASDACTSDIPPTSLRPSSAQPLTLAILDMCAFITRVLECACNPAPADGRQAGAACNPAYPVTGAQLTTVQSGQATGDSHTSTTCSADLLSLMHEPGECSTESLVQYMLLPFSHNDARDEDLLVASEQYMLLPFSHYTVSLLEDEDLLVAPEQIGKKLHALVTQGHLLPGTLEATLCRLLDTLLQELNKQPQHTVIPPNRLLAPGGVGAGQGGFGQEPSSSSSFGAGAGRETVKGLGDTLAWSAMRWFALHGSGYTHGEAWALPSPGQEVGPLVALMRLPLSLTSYARDTDNYLLMREIRTCLQSITFSNIMGSQH
eukprot:gene15368-21452_t